MGFLNILVVTPFFLEEYILGYFFRLLLFRFTLLKIILMGGADFFLRRYCSIPISKSEPFMRKRLHASARTTLPFIRCAFTANFFTIPFIIRGLFSGMTQVGCQRC